MTDPHQKELDRFRQSAERLGLAIPDEDVDELESADEFIARMHAQDAVDIHRARSRRAWWISGGSIAAAFAVLFGVLHQTQAPATADPPPILDYEFASAVRIAYAPGEDPDKMLDLLATTAATATPAPGTGDVQYKQTDNWFTESDGGDGSTSIVPRVTETWLSPDGSWTTRDSTGIPLAPDGRGLKPRDSTGTTKSETLPPGTIDASFEASLPTDPEELANALLNHSECTDRAKGFVRSMCLYREITSLFQMYVVRPDLASAVWQMLRGETGFTNLGSVTDRAGREGIGISIVDEAQPQFRFILMGSLDDGQLLGFEDILIKTVPSVDVQAPSVYAFTAIVKTSRETEAPEVD